MNTIKRDFGMTLGMTVATFFFLLTSFAGAEPLGVYTGVHVTITPDKAMQQLASTLSRTESTRHEAVAVSAKQLMNFQVQRANGLVFRAVDGEIMAVEFPDSWQHPLFTLARSRWIAARNAYVDLFTNGDCANQEKQHLIDITDEIRRLLSRLGDRSRRSYGSASQMIDRLTYLVRQLPTCPDESTIPRFVGSTWHEFLTYVAKHDLRPIVIDIASATAFSDVCTTLELNGKRRDYLVRKSTRQDRIALAKQSAPRRQSSLSTWHDSDRVPAVSTSYGGRSTANMYRTFGTHRTYRTVPTTTTFRTYTYSR